MAFVASDAFVPLLWHGPVLEAEHRPFFGTPVLEHIAVMRDSSRTLSTAELIDVPVSRFAGPG